MRLLDQPSQNRRQYFQVREKDSLLKAKPSLPLVSTASGVVINPKDLQWDVAFKLWSTFDRKHGKVIGVCK